MPWTLQVSRSHSRRQLVHRHRTEPASSELGGDEGKGVDDEAAHARRSEPVAVVEEDDCSGAEPAGHPAGYVPRIRRRPLAPPCGPQHRLEPHRPSDSQRRAGGLPVGGPVPARRVPERAQGLPGALEIASNPHG